MLWHFCRRRLNLTPPNISHMTWHPLTLAPAFHSSHTFTLTPAEQDIASFKHLLKDVQRCEQVNKVSLWTRTNDESESNSPAKSVYISDPWRECVSLLSKLPNLKEVGLRFDCRVGDPVDRHGFVVYHDPLETVDFRTDILNTLFTALHHPHMHVDTLSIEHLQDYTRSVYLTPAFQHVRAKLTSLHLNVSMEYSNNGSEDIQIPEKHDFYNQDLNTHWLEPLQHQITHLTLHASDFWGVYPRWDPRALHFPRLQSLALGRWSIAHEWQVHWLLSHAATLEALYLEDCPIVYALSLVSYQHESLSWEPGEHLVVDDWRRTGRLFPPLRWGPVLAQLRTRLKLKRFGLVHVPLPVYLDPDERFAQRYDIPARLGENRYAVFDGGLAPTPWILGDFHERGCWCYDDDAELEGGCGDDMVRLKQPGDEETERRALYALKDAEARN